ncbi:DUF4150 domain-containing protein [Rugamonas sp. FT107W]|uniref:DUF4150 domain-containing protein n=1 Tax=Duganella vulcania TaxID=2692166 RepID=A0A845HUK5_9BURK|nr:DUF4150 domain-containing protein [Duganella vulcania]MYN20056.1 DUF4150 domain-containing protein [Duganella vulcania]
MTDRLKLSDPSLDIQADKVAKELMLKDELDEKERKLKRNIAAIQAEITKAKQNPPAPSPSASNKIGARKEGTFKAISTAPSINKTPIGPSMVPIPYPVVQDLSSSINTARTVNFNGCPAYVIDGSTQPRCTGDEAGTGKGVKSGTVSGEVKPVAGSSTVRIEGKKVVRDGDACTMNGGNNPGIYITSSVAGSVAPKDALAFANPTLKTKKSRFQKWLHKTSFDISEAIAHPSDAMHGAARGIANIPPQLAELLLKGVVEQQAAELNEAASMQALLGHTHTAQDMTDMAKSSQHVGARIDLPKFKMRNAAEEGGDTVATIAQLFSGGAGVAKIAVIGVAKLIHVTETVTKVTEELSVRVVKAGESLTMVTGPASDGVRIVRKVKASAAGNFRAIVNKISGKVLNEADALNPGALGDDLKGLAETYSGGRYATIKLDKPLTVYRAWAPGQSKEFGAFWTLEKPEGALQARIDSALLPDWGDVRGTAYRTQATEYTMIEIPAGVTIHIGEVGAQGSTWVGGKSQLLIDGGAQAIWKTGGGPLK